MLHDLSRHLWLRLESRPGDCRGNGRSDVRLSLSPDLPAVCRGQVSPVCRTACSVVCRHLHDVFLLLRFPRRLLVPKLVAERVAFLDPFWVWDELRITPEWRTAAKKCYGSGCILCQKSKGKDSNWFWLLPYIPVWCGISRIFKKYLLGIFGIIGQNKRDPPHCGMSLNVYLPARVFRSGGDVSRSRFSHLGPPPF